MDARERFALNSLTDLLREGHDPEAAARFMISLGMAEELVERAAELYADLAKGVREMKEPRILIDGTHVPQPWYGGPAPKDLHWPALERHLSDKPGWNGTPLKNLDSSSSKVVSYLEPPYATQIRTRGLAVGYVQSGKTSNYTAVIAKAADAGYRLFVVLSGVHNNLRRQTQLRLEEQLVDLNPELWVPLTSIDQDFGQPLKATPLLAQPSLRLLAVVKKHGLRLTKLWNWLDTANKSGILERCPVLVIDDEADQASPNTRKAEEERAAINKLIIDLLGFPRVAYVGYTATPFANFFIDPTYPEDLYPRHFIVELPRSDDYFGAERLFGREPAHPDDPEPEPFDVIRKVPPEDLLCLLPTAKKDTAFNPSVPGSLRQATRWFLMATTARRLREGQPRHTTMLIHTSGSVRLHEKMWGPVVAEITTLDAAISAGDPVTLADLAGQWTSETAKIDGRAWGHEPLPSDRVLAGLRQTIALLGNLADQTDDTCGVVVDNSFSPRRLVYDEENPLPVIVIGGNTLARGLTLEGLVSSLFVRTAATYDVLLQMARWFGYRRNYEDLPRMWLTANLRKQFRMLAGVEEQIREEIRRYEEEGLIPAQVPVRVQMLPGLAITAFNKMRATRPFKMSYSGQRPQTILFQTDKTWLERNLLATRILLTTVIQSGAEQVDGGNRFVLRGAPVDLILDFFSGDEGYQFHPENTELRKETLLAYIGAQNQRDELLLWNIAVVSRKENAFGDLEVGLPRRVNLIGRARSGDDPRLDTFDIGILTNQIDWVIDLDVATSGKPALPDMKQRRTDSGRAVLLLYPIARNSKAKSSEKQDLDVEEHVIGVSIAFPKAKSDSTPQNYRSVQTTAASGPADTQFEEAEEDEDDARLTGQNDGEGDLNDARIAAS